MADITFGILSGIFKKLRDMGDGTHAEVVAMDGYPLDLQKVVVGSDTYIGEAAPGTSRSASTGWRWQRKRVDATGTTFRWAASGGFDQPGSNPSALIYGD